jgi:hypothetical protein
MTVGNEILGALARANKYNMLNKKATLNYKKADPYSGDMDVTGTIVSLDAAGIMVMFEDEQISFYPWTSIFRVDVLNG